MSYSLGVKIKELRQERMVNQEQMANALGITRQRYIRIENGQADISFVIIRKIADYLGVPTSAIINIEEEEKGLVALFKEEDMGEDVINSVAKVEEILKVFHAHEKLYHQMKARDDLAN